MSGHDGVVVIGAASAAVMLNVSNQSLFSILLTPKTIFQLFVCLIDETLWHAV